IGIAVTTHRRLSERRTVKPKPRARLSKQPYCSELRSSALRRCLAICEAAPISFRGEFLNRRCDAENKFACFHQARDSSSLAVKIRKCFQDFSPEISRPGRIKREVEKTTEPGQHVVGHAAGIQQGRSTLDSAVEITNCSVEDREKAFGEVLSFRTLTINARQELKTCDARKVETYATYRRRHAAIAFQSQTDVKKTSCRLINQKIQSAGRGNLPIHRM